MNNRNLAYDEACEANAPPWYQAEVLRGQVCDDLNRRFWRSRKRLAEIIDDRKDAVQHDFERLNPRDFLAKYNGWKFR
jgi:hypothetical protein